MTIRMSIFHAQFPSINYLLSNPNFYCHYCFYFNDAAAWRNNEDVGVVGVIVERNIIINF